MIRGEKIILRAVEEEDLEDWQRWLSKPEIARGLIMRYPVSRLAERQLIEQSARPQPNDKIFAIDTLAGLYIGSCGLHRISWEDRRATLGIFIGQRSQWGKGYGTDATRVLVRFGFDEMNLNRIDLHVFADNERAIRCYETVGFVREGVLRQFHYLEGGTVDIVVMSVLRDEYVAQSTEG